MDMITTLLSLETLSMTFNAREIKDSTHPIFNHLEFPNVAEISIYVIIQATTTGISDDPEDEPEPDIQNYVCCPLRDQSQYPNLSHFELKYWMDGQHIVALHFDRRDGSPNVKLVLNEKIVCKHSEEIDEFEVIEDNKEYEESLIDTANALSIACMEKLHPVFLRQPGWQDLAKMTVVTESQDQFAFIKDTFHDWDIQHHPVDILI